MTISASIIAWLKGFDTSTQMASIDTDVQAATAATYSLAKEPVINKTTYLSGLQKITEHYTLVARLNLSNNTKRIQNVTWGEALEEWVKAQNDSKSFPTLEEGCTAQKVEVTTPMYLGTSRDTTTGLYQLTIALTYMRKGE